MVGGMDGGTTVHMKFHENVKSSKAIISGMVSHVYYQKRGVLPPS